MIIGKVQSVGAVIVCPVALMMGFPVFLFQIVFEKEKKLIDIMKINGMKMTNYWLIQFLFNYALYVIIVIFYIYAGLNIF